MIDYILKPNKLTREGKKLSAQVINTRSYTFDDIAKHLIRHNTGLSSSVIYGLWEGIKDAVEEFVSEGASINTELFNVHASIRGVFDGMDDGFDSSRHQIRLNLQPGLMLRAIPKKLKVRKFNPEAQSMIFSVTDIKSGSVNDTLTPGKNIRIIGKRLKIDGTDPACGLYFIPVDNSEQQVKIELSEVVVNKPSEIIAVVPKLKKGNWNLRVVTQFSRGKQCLKVPYHMTFEKHLNVALVSFHCHIQKK